MTSTSQLEAMVEPRKSAPDSIAVVERAAAELATGRMVVIRDSVERGGEGDVLVAADYATPEAINFMVRQARGLVRIALTPDRCRDLGLEPIGEVDDASGGTVPMVSIEARTGVSTGISVADRARTIEVAIDPTAAAGDIVQPGHVFPLRVPSGGPLERGGRPAAAVDLARLSGTRPAAVLCEILCEDGHVARAAQLDDFAAAHGLTVVSVADVVEYRADARVEDGGDEQLGRRMRDVMGHFATGVTVITARRRDGVPTGTTANAVSSVSLRPPLLLVCLANESETLAAVRATGWFAVNILGSHQRHHSERFALKGDEARAHEVEFDEHVTGLPILPGSLAGVTCEVDAIHPAGDHSVVLGRVRSLEADASEFEPLLFYRGGYSEII